MPFYNLYKVEILNENFLNFAPINRKFLNENFESDDIGFRQPLYLLNQTTAMNFAEF